METAKERPRGKNRSVQSNSMTALDLPDPSTVDSRVVQRLVKQVEHLEVADDRIDAAAAKTESLLRCDSATLEEAIPGPDNLREENADGESAPIPELVMPVEGTSAESEITVGSDQTAQAEERADSSAAIADVAISSKHESVSKVPLASEAIHSASACQLYPGLDQMRLRELEANAEPQQAIPKSVRLRESAPPLVAAFEALTEMQLRSFYYNCELERVDDFVDEFLKATLRPMAGDEFFVLLQSYLDCCRRVEQLQLDAQDLNQRWDSARRNVWLLENVVLKHQASCGEGRPAHGVYTVQRAKFQENCYEELKNLAQKRRNLRIFQLALASHQAKTAELQCKHHLASAVNAYRTLAGVAAVSPLFLSFDDPPQQIARTRSQVHNCINALFHFMRLPLGDSTFVNSCRFWLNELCGTVLRHSFVDDHLFILSHVLRCPNGIGSWASGYVQPVCQLDSTTNGERAVDHFLAMLSVCLNPIRRREDYLRGFLSPDVVNSWTIVDADGEEESEMLAISEADLLCLLNQFSFDRLFSSWFQNLQKSELTESRILRLFAFGLTFLRILFDGTRAYNGIRYKQICKQLAYEMRKSVQYVAEFWSYFKSFQSDSLLCSRLQLEFDRLVLYTVFYGLSSKGSGVWQFLADLPYSDVSDECQWRLAGLLLLSTGDAVSPRELAQKPVAHIRQELTDPKILEFRLHDLDESDALYLITALSAMASSSQDDNLVITLTTFLFTACFETPSTREVHHKAGRQLIRTVVERHIWLFSYLLKMVEARLDNLGGYAIELFDHLPNVLWRLDDGDWSILRRWLFQPLSSLRNALSQRILLTCNWGMDHTAVTLFIAPHLHRQLAEAIAKSYGILCPVQGGLVSGSIKKATKVASSMSGQTSMEQQFMDFCWTLLLRVKIHPFDSQCLSDTEVPLNEAEREDMLVQARRGNPAAAFVAFQLYARSVDSLIKFGFGLIEQLLNNSFAKPATVGVVYAMRLLAEQGSSHCDERWQRCVDTLLHFDDTYYHYAKTFIGGNFEGENLSHFASMLSDTVLALTSRRQADASKFVHYCVQLFCCSTVRPWCNDRPSLYIMDRLIEAGFLNDPSMRDIVQILRFAYESTILAQHRETKGGVLSVFRGEKPPPPLLHSSYFREFPWFAFASIKAEEITFQQFYRHLASEVMRNSSQTVENCVKHCAKKYDMSFTVDRLTAFMFMELCCALNGDHPLLPLACQQCCLALLQRMRIADDPSLPATCLGSQYLRTSLFSDKLIALKKLLESASLGQKVENQRNQMVTSRLQLFGAVSCWISDSRLYDQSLPASISSLPQFYLLESVLNGNETLWLDYVDFAAVRTSVEIRSKDWTKCRYGDSSNVSIHIDRPSTVSPLRRLLDRLQHGEEHSSMPPPAIGLLQPVTCELDINTLKEESNLLAVVNPLLDNFYAAANDFNDMHKSIITLDGLFFDQIKLLYTDVSVQVTVALKCGRSCANPNNKKIAAKTSKVQDSVQNSLDQNRRSWCGTIDNVSALLSYNIPHHCVSFYAMARQLARLCGDAVLAEAVRTKLKKTGVRLFHKLICACNDRILGFPPTKDLFHACLGTLGGVFILGNAKEVERLLDLLREKEPLFPLLITIFDPSCATNTSYLKMYEKLSNWMKGGNMPCDRIVQCFKKMNVKTALSRLDRSQTDQVNRLALRASIAANKEPYLSVLEVLRIDWVESFLVGLPGSFRPSLESLLQASEQRTVPVVLFDDLLVALSSTVSNISTPIGPAVFAEIVKYLSDYFRVRKSKCKDCASSGIYHCWESYGEKLPQLLAFCFMHSILNPDVYASPAEGIRLSISSLETLFHPWIEPICTDNKVHPPCSLSSASLFDGFLNAFIDSLCFIQRLFSDPSNESTVAVLTLCLEWYVRKINRSVDKLGSCLLRSYHTHLLRLPWHQFLPSITTMEAMRQMVQAQTQSSPFVTSLLVRFPWSEVLRSPIDSPSPARMALCDLLLNTVVISSTNERNYADCKASLPELLHTMASADWSFLELSTVEALCEHISRAYDPRGVVCPDSPRSVASGVLKLISAASCFSNFPQSASPASRGVITQKRVRYVKMVVTLAIRCSRLLDIPATTLCQYFVDLIGQVDSLLRTDDGIVDKRDETLQLLSQAVLFLHHINQQLFDDTVTAICHWLRDHPDSLVPLGLIPAYGTVTVNYGGSPPPSWAELLDWLSYCPPLETSLKQVCQQKGAFLLFYAVCCKRLEQRRELSNETVILREAIETLLVVSERQFCEAPLVVVIGHAVELLTRQSKFGAGASSLVTLARETSSCLRNAADGKSGILSTLGLTKRIAYSPRFQLLCTVLANYLEQQIIDDSHIRRQAAAVITNSREQWAKNLRSQKQYSSFVDVINITNSFFTDSSMHFDDVVALYSKMAPVLFSERYISDQCAAYSQL